MQNKTQNTLLVLQGTKSVFKTIKKKKNCNNHSPSSSGKKGQIKIQLRTIYSSSLIKT